jgi:excisionase family DNA binding protein
MDEIMTTSQVAALLQIHARTVHRLSRRGVLPGSRIGRRWRFSRREIVALVSNPARRRALEAPLEPSPRTPRAKGGGPRNGAGPEPAGKV